MASGPTPHKEAGSYKAQALRDAPGLGLDLPAGVGCPIYRFVVVQRRRFLAAPKIASVCVDTLARPFTTLWQVACKPVGKAQISAAQVVLTATDIVSIAAAAPRAATA